MTPIEVKAIMMMKINNTTSNTPMYMIDYKNNLTITMSSSKDQVNFLT